MEDEFEKTMSWMFKLLGTMIFVLLLGLLIPQSIIEWKKALSYKEPTSVHDITIEDNRK